MNKKIASAVVMKTTDFINMLISYSIFSLPTIEHFFSCFCVFHYERHAREESSNYTAEERKTKGVLSTLAINETVHSR